MDQITVRILLQDSCDAGLLSLGVKNDGFSKFCGAGKLLNENLPLELQADLAPDAVQPDLPHDIHLREKREHSFCRFFLTVPGMEPRSEHHPGTKIGEGSQMGLQKTVFSAGCGAEKGKHLLAAPGLQLLQAFIVRVGVTQLRDHSFL